MNPQFSIKEKVFLPDEIGSNIPGRIVNIWISESGIQYKVRYFWQGEAKEIYFFEDELRR